MGSLLNVIASGVRPDVPGEMAKAQQARALQLENQMAPMRQQLAQQQVIGAQQENEQRAIQLRDSSIMGWALQRTGNMKDALPLALQNGMSGPTYSGYLKSQADYDKTLADTEHLRAGTEKDVSDIAKAEDEAFKAHLGSALNAGAETNWEDQGAVKRGLDVAIADTARDQPRVAARLRQFGASLPQDPAQAKAFLQSQYDATPAATQRASLLSEASKEKETTASIALKEAQTAGEQAKGRIDKIKADAMEAFSKNPQSGLASIDAIIPNGPMNQVYKAEYQAAMSMGDMDGAKAAISHAAEHAGRIAQATDPNIIKAEIGKSVAIEQATAPLKLAQSVATARAMSGTGAVANVPPHLAATAIADYNKSAQALAHAQTQTDDIQTLLDMAGAGNKAAGANVPLAGVGAINAVNGIKRINSAEIHQYGTAGSLLDRIQGKLQGWTEGKPIPQDVLNDMKALHEELAKGAQTQHAREVQSINQSYGSTFTPIQFAAKAPAAAPMIRARDPQGNLHEAPTGTPLPAGWKLESK